MKSSILGKKFASGEVNDVVFDWDNTITIPSVPEPTSAKQGNIHGQKNDICHISQNERLPGSKNNPVRTAKAGISARTKAQAGPELERKSKPSQEKRATPRGKDIARPVHHLPGSTVPHMRRGSIRTQKAATWLAGEQHEKRKVHDDRTKAREAAREREEDRRKKLLSAACTKEDSDLQRVQEGKEPMHAGHMLHAMSLQHRMAGSRGSDSVLDRPIYSTGCAKHSADNSNTGTINMLTRPPVPRLSKVIIQRSGSSASRQADNPSAAAVAAARGEGYESDDIDAPPPPAPDLLAKYASSKGTPLPTDLPSPGVDIRLRETFLSNDSDHDGLADFDEAAFAQPRERKDDDNQEDYGEDSDFEGCDERERPREDGGVGVADAGGDKNVFELSDDEGGSVDEFGSGRSVGNTSGNTADSARLKRRSQGRLYLEQRRKQEMSDLHRKRKAKEKEDTEKKERLQRLDVTRKSMLKSAGKLKSIPVHTSTERVPTRPAPTVLQPPVPGKSAYTETQGYHHAIGVSVYGEDRSPRCDIPFRDREGGDGTGMSSTNGGDVNWALDDAVIGDATLEPPRAALFPTGVSHDPPSRRQRQPGTHSESPPRFRERGEPVKSPVDAPRLKSHPHHDHELFGEGEFFGLDGQVYGTSSSDKRVAQARVRQNRPSTVGANATSRNKRVSRPSVERSRQRSRSTGNVRPQQQRVKRPFCVGSTDAHSSSIGRPQSAGKLQQRTVAVLSADEVSRRQRRKPEIPHHVFSSSCRGKRLSSRDAGRKSDSDKENREQPSIRRGTGRGKSAQIQKKHSSDGDISGPGPDHDMNAHLVDLLNDQKDIASWPARKEHPLYPIRQADDNELLESVKSIMENRFRGEESSQPGAAAPTHQHHVKVKSGAVLAQVDRNDSAAAQLLKSMERLRSEVAGYSENIRQFAHVRESTGELEMLRASIHSRLSLAASVESDRSGSPPSPPNFDNADGDSEDRWTEDCMDMVRFDDASQEGGGDDSCQSRSSAGDDDGSERRYSGQFPSAHRQHHTDDEDEDFDTGLPQYRRAEGVNEFNSHGTNSTGGFQSTDFYQPRTQPHSGSSPESMNYGDSMMQQQMGLLQDKRDILAKYLGDTAADDDMDHPNDFTTSGDELVWGGSAYKIEKVGGLERLVKTMSSDGKNSQWSDTTTAPLSLRNVGELAGIMTTTGTRGSIGRDRSEYSDSEASNDGDSSLGEDHRIVSIFANEIYRQRVEEALQLEQAEFRKQVLEETYQRAESELHKQRVESPVHTRDEPSMYVSPAEATPRSADGSAGFDDRSLSPRTYWDMMISRGALPSSNDTNTPVVEARGTISTAESYQAADEAEPWTIADELDRKREADFLRAARTREAAKGDEFEGSMESSPPPRYTGAELRLMLTEALHKQENMFNIAMELGEVAQTHTVQTASQAMQQIVQHADKEANELARNYELAQMQHAYELSLAMTTAEAALVVQREMAAKESEFAETKQQLLRQGMEQEHAHILTNTIQNVDLASELFDLRQMAARAEELKRDADAQAAASAAIIQTVSPHPADMATHIQVSTGTMTDDNGCVVAPSPQSELDAPWKHAPTATSSKSNIDIEVRPEDDEDDDYSASFDEESRIFHRSPAPAAVVRFNDARIEQSIASEVNESAVDPDEYSFVEESYALSSPGKRDQSIGEVSESMLDVNASTSAHDYSEDFASQTALSMASTSVPSKAPIRAGKPPTPTTAAPPSRALSPSGTDLFAQYLAEIDNRIRSQEKSIAVRLQLEKRKLEHELYLLKTAQQSTKTALSKADYPDAVRSIENDYHASVAELERERWTMNARAYKERKKYEQLRRDLEISSKETGSRGSLSEPVHGSRAHAPRRPAAQTALEGSYSYDHSFESVGRSTVATSPQRHHIGASHQRQSSLDVSESFESNMQAIEESFTSVISEYNPGEPSQQMSYLQDDFEVLDEGDISRSAAEVDADEYSSEVFEALSFVEGPGVSHSKGSKPPLPLYANSPSPTRANTWNGAKTPSLAPTSKEASDVPTFEELQRRSQLLQDKRAEAADIIRQRTEEIERRKELIRIEEEEREVERLLQQAKRLDVERELEDHRKAARLEAKKNVHVAYSDVATKQHRPEHKRSIAEKSSFENISHTLHEQRKPASHKVIRHQERHSDEDAEDEEDEYTAVEEDYSVDTEVGEESPHEDEIPDDTQEVSEVADDNIYEDDIYDEVSDDGHRQHVSVAASTSQLAAVSYADDFEEEQSADITAKKVHVSRNASYEYLSDFEDTDGQDRSDAEEQSIGQRLVHQHSQSSDTFAELDESLDRRTNRINELKQKIEKAQSTHKLERLRAKQAERERLQLEEAELIARLESEENAYRMEKERILKGIAEEEQAPDDVIVNRLIETLHDPVEEELRIFDDEDALAGDSFSSQPGQGGGSVLQNAFEGQVAMRVREIEAATKIQAMERARNAKRIAEEFRKTKAAYEVKGDLVEEHKHLKGAQELVMEDSFGSDSTGFSAEVAGSSEEAELAEREAELMAMEAAAENMRKIVASQTKLSLAIDTSSIASSVTPEDTTSSPHTGTPVLQLAPHGHTKPNVVGGLDGNIDEMKVDLGVTQRRQSNAKDTALPEHKPPGLTAEFSDLSESVTPRPDSAFSALTQTPTAQLYETGGMLAEPESDVEEILDEEASLSRSAHSIAEPAALSMSSAAALQSTTAAGGDLGESSRDTVVWAPPRTASKKQRLLAALEASMDEDSSFMARVGSVDDQTIETSRTIDTLDTNKSSQDEGDMPLPTEAPALILKESELSLLVRSSGRPVDLPTAIAEEGGTEEYASGVEKAHVPLRNEEEAVESTGKEGGSEEYDDSDDEFEAAEDVSPPVANADKVPVCAEEESVEEVEDEEFIGGGSDIADVSDRQELSFQEVFAREQVDMSGANELDMEESVDWFEESEEEVDEGDLNRTMDSIGVDIVEDVRSPSKKQSLLIQGSSLTTTPREIKGAVSTERDVGKGEYEDFSSPPEASVAQSLPITDRIARLLAGCSSEDKQGMANEVTDILMQRLLNSTMASDAVKDAMFSAVKPAHLSAAPSGEVGVDQESVESTASANVVEEEYSIGEEDDDRIVQRSQLEKNAVHPVLTQTQENSTEAERGLREEDEEEAEGDYSFQDFDDEDDAPAAEGTGPAVRTPLETDPAHPTTASLTSLSALPSLGKIRNGGSDDPMSTLAPSVRDSSLDALLGEDDDVYAVTDNKSKLSPRFGKPAKARESDAFADTAVVKKEESVNEMWVRRKKMYVDELFAALDGNVMDNLIKDLGNPDFDSQEGIMISEEVYVNIELRRVQEITADEDLDPDGVSQEATQMNHKVIFDRVNEVLCELHLLRHTAKGCGPPAPYNRRVIAKCLPLDREHVLPFLKERLLPPPPKPITTTLEDGTTVVQPRSILDSLKIPTLDSLRDEVQTSLLDTAEYVTDVILTRMLVEVANIAVVCFSS